MGTCTEAVRLSLGGEINSLFEASEARSQAAYYASEGNLLLKFKEENRLIFMGVLFVKNPDMMSAFVEHDSEYPGRYWETSEFQSVSVVVVVANLLGKSDTGK